MADSTRRKAELTAVSCRRCGMTVLVTPAHALRRQYCSMVCRKADGYVRGSANRIAYVDCATCGRCFVVRACRLRVHCSTDCEIAGRGVKRKLRTELSCQECGRSFEPSCAQVRKGFGRFCSRPCAVDGRRVFGKPQSLVATAAMDLWQETDERLAVRELRVGRFAIDLALPSLMLAVELDGVFWHGLPGAAERDERKNVALAEAGWTVVRVPIEVLDTPQMLVDKVKAVIPAKRRARKR